MNKLIKYNLEIMTGIFAVVLAASLSQWTELSMLRRMIVVFMVLYTLHEWEESKYPGGFYRIFFSKCTIDPTVSEERMHLPVAIYLLMILLIPYAFDSFAVLALVPLVLALFEGFIHTAGIIIHQLFIALMTSGVACMVMNVPMPALEQAIYSSGEGAPTPYIST